jgi:acetaldehyde dehydrogenase/alcohol dehydrogenase
MEFDMKRFDAQTKLFFGENALDYLLELPPDRALVVTDPYMVSSGAVKAVTGRLDKIGMAYAVFSEVEPDPSIETVAAGMQAVIGAKPNYVIALGGGSAIDAAKAMLYFCIKLQGILTDIQYVHRPTFIAIPTTSGTGSEVTSYAVISDRKQGVKIPLSHRSMVPDAALLDPSFTKTLPKHMIAFTGMDVLTHALEAYVSAQADDFTDMLAAEAAAITLDCLPALYEDANDAAMREKMYSASTMAGLAFTNATLGLCHGIAHTVGARYHVPHGKANAIGRPYGLAETLKDAQTRARSWGLAQRLGSAGGEAGLVAAVKALGARLEIPATLAACDIPEAAFMADMPENIEKMLEDVTTQANPVPVSAANLTELLAEIYAGHGA